MSDMPVWERVYRRHFFELGESDRESFWRMDLVMHRLHRRLVSWYRPPQHHRKRGHMPQLWRILRRVSRGMTTHADADRLLWEIITLRSRLDRAEGELKGMVEQVNNIHRECAFWRDQYQRVSYRLEKEVEDA